MADVHVGEVAVRQRDHPVDHGRYGGGVRQGHHGQGRTQHAVPLPGLLDPARAPRSAEEGRRLEAAWIADRIRTLVESEAPRLRPDSSDPTQSVGPLRYGDVAILFRAAGSLDVYEAALEAAGVPFLTQKSKGFYQAEEIIDLLYVLRVVHNPEDRFALASTAAGPALGATDADLLRWFGAGEGTPWERMCTEADAGGAYADTVATLRRLRVRGARRRDAR